MGKTLRLLLFLFATLLTSCSNYDDTQIKKDLSDLKGLVTDLESRFNANTASVDAILKALQEKDYVIAVTPYIENMVQVGYQLTFAKSAPVIIYWNTDDPEGNTIFKQIAQDENNVYLTLTDDSVIKLPKESELSVSFDLADGLSLQTGITRTISYTVASSMSPVDVQVIPSSAMQATVTPASDGLNGTIAVTAIGVIDEHSQILIVVSNGVKVVMKTLVPTDGGTLVMTDQPFRWVPADGGYVDLSFLSSVDFEVIIPKEAQRWMKPVYTKATESHTVVIGVDENPWEERSAVVTIVSKDKQMSFDYTITQEAPAEIAYLDVQTRGVGEITNTHAMLHGYAYLSSQFESPLELLFYYSSEVNTLEELLSSGMKVSAVRNNNFEFVSTLSFITRNTTYYFVACASYGGRDFYGYVQQFTTTDDSTIPEAVDLGLSVKWASFNLGASAPMEYGGFYSWGETEAKTAFKKSTYKWYDSEQDAFTKYNDYDNKTVLDLDDDAAHVQLGDGWRMPTKGEFEELLNNCKWEKSSLSGVDGFWVTSKTNYNSIFLPICGNFNPDILPYLDNIGCYLSSSSITKDYYWIDHGVWLLWLEYVNQYTNWADISFIVCRRYSGNPIRPVKD